MQIPLFIHTDASFEHGNNTAKEMIDCAKSNNYKSVGLSDYNSMSALVRFLKASSSLDIDTLVSCVLKVKHTKRDAVAWALKNQNIIHWIYSDLNLPYPSLDSAHSELEIFFQSITACASSKAKGRLDALTCSVMELKSFTGVDLSILDESKIKLWAKDSKKVDFTLPYGELVFIANSRIGYKNLLKLISTTALAKKRHIELDDAGNATYAITQEEIEEYGEGIIVVDRFDENSVLGLLRQSPLSDDLSHWVPAFVSSHKYINHIGIRHDAQDDVVLKVGCMSSFGFSIIPFNYANFTQIEKYDEYCVKVAVHRSEIVTSIDFEPPLKNTFIVEHETVLNAYHEISNKINISMGFWESVSSADVELGKICLPNYDMEVKAVIEYAFNSLLGENVSFESDAAAMRVFEERMRIEAPESIPFEEYKQKRLNDFCMHMIAYKGLHKRLEVQFGDEKEAHYKEYKERFDSEYGVIESMGFSGYFLIEYDFVAYARHVGIPVGVGRGSAAGSLIVYCMEITDVDPIIYGLQFERFLNPERVSMPDIDVDFGEGGDYDRSSVLKYIASKYKQDGSLFPSSSQIANINRYQLKSALSAVRNAYGLSMSFDAFLKYIVKTSEQELGVTNPTGITWDEFLSLNYVSKLMNSHPVLKKVMMMAKSLSGKMSTYGVHAGGIVISPTVIPDYSAISCDDKGNFFSQLDKDDIESAGLIKFDVLGLKNLSVISEAVRLIEENRGIKLDIRTIDDSDAAVFTLIGSQVLSDVFQLESGGMRELVGKLQPQSIEEIAVLSALYRPGALDSGMVEDYVDVKYGKKELKYDHPALEKVTGSTYGCIVYQEQVMSIVRELAGYSLGEADLLRRAMGKKKIEEMQKQKAVYGLRSQQHWSDHYIEVGNKLGFEFILNVDLSDLEDVFLKMELVDSVNGKYYLATAETVIPFISKLLRLTKDDVGMLMSRIDDMSYTVSLFKEHYQVAIDSAIRNKFKTLALDGSVDEVSKRCYYAMTQFIRFNQIFNKVEKFAGYGFNKSHAIAYSVITYQTAYLKTHYAAEYYSSVLTFKGLDKLHSTVAEATQKMGVKLLPPNINKSKDKFIVEGRNGIRYGFGKLRTMGKSGVVIEEERERAGYYINLYDFMSRLADQKGKPTSGSIYSLAMTGAFDVFIPGEIILAPNLNGRQFIFWLSGLYQKSAAYKRGCDDPLHGLLLDMNMFELYVYFSVMAGVNVLFKDELISPSQKELMKKKVLDAEIVQRAFKLKAAEDNPSVTQRILESVALCSGKLSKTSADFVNLYSMFKGDKGFIESWSAFLNKVLGGSVTETLNAERHASGMYMTSTPIKVLKIAERVEMEPPSSIIDGCPVPVKVIDSSYDEQQVTTYGIVRNLVIKAVKKETSKYYNEKMLFCDLEHGADIVSCMIFGNKPVNAVFEKVLSEGAVIMAAGKIEDGDFGITLKISAIKRYYPVEDESVFVVPNNF